MNKRYKTMLRMLFISSPMKRARYMKEKGIFHSIGDRCMITSRKVPLYAKLISIGNNVWMASGVEFVTHDVCHYMLNGYDTSRRYTEKIGCIEIGDNVFIGADVKILYDVKIGDNVIIAAGSIVNKDIPSNSVVGGIPAKVLGPFDKFVEKRKEFNVENVADNNNMDISAACEEEMWKRFRDSRK